MKAVSVAHAINVLNDALARDPEAVSALVRTRVPTNAAMAEHPTIQVAAKKQQRVRDSAVEYTLGLLGILNGIFGIRDNGLGHIVAVVEDDGTVSRFLSGDEHEAESRGEGEPN